MLFIKGIYLLLSHLPTSPTFGGCLSHRPPSPIGLRIPIVRHHHRIAPTAQYTTMRKTAEERFNMLARGWLAYPVTPMHARLPPKSGCRNVIPRFALSRRRATALFRNPVCKAQRSVPGFSSTPTSACRRYATSPPSAVASPHRPPSSSDCASTSSVIPSVCPPRDTLRRNHPKYADLCLPFKLSNFASKKQCSI